MEFVARKSLDELLFVDEEAIAKALKTGQIDQYAFEAESVKKSPFEDIEYALMLKPFSSYTKKTLERNRETLVRNVEGMVRGIPFSRVSL